MAAADTIDSLLNLPDNKVYLPMLVRQISSAGVVPFVGAGYQRLSASRNGPSFCSMRQNRPADGSDSVVDE
ncbi:MAG TPA: hypothetical protein VEX68_20755 [Bryobacteraceae bacterium]|nr:hypothetical protein [Bryobacteraceae bacterium]